MTTSDARRAARGAPMHEMANPTARQPVAARAEADRRRRLPPAERMEFWPVPDRATAHPAAPPRASVRRSRGALGDATTCLTERLTAHHATRRAPHHTTHPLEVETSCCFD